MDLFVFFAVLAAASLHAGWNAVVKMGLDRFSSTLLLTLSSTAISIVCAPFVALPPLAAFPWIMASAILHTGYILFLSNAYVHGDLSQVYPLARGSAPLIVSLVSVPLIGEPIGPSGMVAVIAIAGGVILMSLRGGADLSRMSGHALFFALGTACFTAGYTIVDGMGARVAGTSSGYIVWLMIVHGALLLTVSCLWRGWRVLPDLIPSWKSGLAAGAMSLLSYWIAIWAFMQAPIALVAALRETSVLFAMLFAILFLDERATRWRWAAAGTILCGVVLMRV